MRGPHVFYESDPAQLHARHSFTESLPVTSSTLEIVALDCEMVYTTGGFRIARVCVVNTDGQQVFDELIKMDDGVQVVYVIAVSIPVRVFLRKDTPGILIRVSLASVLTSTQPGRCIL